jgi:putative transposase
LGAPLPREARQTRGGQALQELIRRMSSANAGWGSPRIVGELAKLGIRVAKSTVEKYMVRPRKPPSPKWRAFLDIT